jgi:deoxyhypusine synthase
MEHNKLYIEKLQKIKDTYIKERNLTEEEKTIIEIFYKLLLK